MAKSYRYRARAMRLDLDDTTRRKLERLVTLLRVAPGQFGTVTAQSVAPEVFRRGVDVMLAEAQRATE